MKLKFTGFSESLPNVRTLSEADRSHFGLAIHILFSFCIGSDEKFPDFSGVETIIIFVYYANVVIMKSFRSDIRTVGEIYCFDFRKK